MNLEEDRLCHGPNGTRAYVSKPINDHHGNVIPFFYPSESDVKRNYLWSQVQRVKLEGA